MYVVNMVKTYKRNKSVNMFFLQFFFPCFMSLTIMANTKQKGHVYNILRSTSAGDYINTVLMFVLQLLLIPNCYVFYQ